MAMDVKEKLIKLLEEPCGGLYPACELADYLLSNGITMQKWISVKDRLPNKDGAYLVATNGVSGLQNVKTRWFTKDGEMVDAYDLAGQKDVWYLYDSECGYVSINSVTHWMPLPEPPKEG